MMRNTIVIAGIAIILLVLLGCLGPSLTGEDTAMVTVRLVRAVGADITPEDFALITSVSVTLDGENGTYTETANIIPNLQSAVALFAGIPPGAFSGFSVQATGMSTPNAETLSFTLSAASQLTIEVQMDWNVPTVVAREIVSASGGPTTGIGFVSTNDHESSEVSHTLRTVGVGEVAEMSFVQVDYPDGITYFMGSKPSGPVYITFTSNTNGFVVDRLYFDHVSEEPKINGDYLLSVDYGAGHTHSGSTNVFINFTGISSHAGFTDDGGGPFVFQGDGAVDSFTDQQFEVNLTDVPATGIRTLLFYVFRRTFNGNSEVVSSTVISGPGLPMVITVPHMPDPDDTLVSNEDYGAVVLLFDADINIEFLNYISDYYGPKDMESVINLILALDGLYSEFEIDFISGASIYFRTN